MFSITHEGEGLERVAILRDEAAGSEVRVAVGYGFNVFSFKIRTESGVADLLYAEEGFPRADLRATANGTPILVPFPNRIAGGKFTYNCKTYSIPCNDHGVNAIHGFAFDKPWRIVEESPGDSPPSIVGEFEMLRDSPFTDEQWPGNFRVRCELTLYGRQLDQRFTITNLSDRRIPFGLGTHPYFLLSDDLDQCEIIVNAKTVVELDKTIPTGKTNPVDAETRLALTYMVDGQSGLAPVPIGSRKLDHVFTGLRGESDSSRQVVFPFSHHIIDQKVGHRFLTTISHFNDFPYVVVYIAPHRKAICIEPYTCVTNAVNLGDWLGPDGPLTGLWHLQPGEERTTTISMSATILDRSEDAE
jgi:aldose 1-epimerase